MNRKERRALEKVNNLKAAGLNLGGGGFGLGNLINTPASGQRPAVNPFVIPKDTGLNIISKTFPSNYYVEWNLSTWRAACDQAIKMGFPISYAALTSWTFESSAFVQSLFNQIENAIGKEPLFLVDSRGNPLEEWDKALTSKQWFKTLCKEIVFAKFWGFSGINFDPYGEKVYKYPMQELDPINRLLRESTYNFGNGLKFEENINLLFVQPNSNYESFLGWMQPITRSFIQTNIIKNNWVGAGRRFAFPLMTVGYPQDGEASDSNGNALNPYRLEAEEIVRNADPTNGLVYPYTRNADGEIQKTLEIGADGGNKGGVGAHRIYSDFNQTEKDEIREMIFGGTLTSSTAANGARALGEVHKEKFDDVIKNLIEFLIAELNGEFLVKIAKFYKQWPAGATFDINRSKRWDLTEIEKLSKVLVENGKKFTTEFFEEFGLQPEFIEENAMAGIMPAIGGQSVKPANKVVETKEKAEKSSGFINNLFKKKL